jgi:hypothetical protein
MRRGAACARTGSDWTHSRRIQALTLGALVVTTACHREELTPSAPDAASIAPRPAPSPVEAGAPAKPPRASSVPDAAPTCLASCADLLARNKTVLSLLEGCPSCVEGVEKATDGCRVDATGFWGFVVEHPWLDVAHGAPTGYGVKVRLIRQSSRQDGGACGEANGYESGELRILENGRKTDDRASLQTFDYDHDGVPEALVAHPLATITQFRTGPLGAGLDVYKPATGLIIGGFEDVDGDGRPDLEIANPYGGDAMFLAHSLPDGTFSQKDDVAKGFAARHCPKPGLDVVDLRPDDRNDVLRRIACARLHGVSASAVEDALQSYREALCKGAPECKARDGGLSLFPAYAKHAISLEPPFLLP